MALIKCKNCGNLISDTSKKCIHCSLKISCNSGVEQSDNCVINLKKFNQLTRGEKGQLLGEFVNEYPRCIKYSDELNNFVEKRNLLVLYYILIINSCLLALSFFAKDFIKNLDDISFYILMTTIIIAIIIGLIMCIVSAIHKKIHRHGYLQAIKIYQYWLKSVKNIELSISFAFKKNKKYFDSIDIFTSKLYKRR